MPAPAYTPAQIEASFWEKVDKDASLIIDTPCWEWTASTVGGGYGSFRSRSNDLGTCYAHRISWMWHHGLIPDGLWVLHRCDNPPCVRPDHLFLGTAQDNVDDMVTKGRQRINDRRGEKNANVKLSAAVVRDIRRRHSAGETNCAIGRELGITNSHISSIVRRASWAHVEDGR